MIGGCQFCPHRTHVGPCTGLVGSDSCGCTTTTITTGAGLTPRQAYFAAAITGVFSRFGAVGTNPRDGVNLAWEIAREADRLEKERA